MSTATCRKVVSLLFLLIAFIPPRLSAQDQDSGQITRLNFYLDCFRCPDQYVKEHINIVNFVRDPAVAQIQMVMTRANSGGGTEFTLRFVGLGDFEGIDNTMVYYSASTAIEEEEREEFLRNVRLGLLPYINRSTFKKYIDVTYEYTGIDSEETRIDDPWNHWVFDINSDFSIEGQETRKTYEIEGRFSADRVTNAWKIDTDLSGSYERTFVDLEVDDGDTTKTTVNTFSFLQSRKRFNGLIVKSLNRHWSVGGSVFAINSTFNNYKLKVGIGPAVEFNIFPYAEYNRHELSFLYEISPVYVQYNDTTLFNKIDEFLAQQTFSINYEVTETWGDIDVGMEAATYLHDFSKNHLEFRGRLSFRLFRGFSVFMRGEYSLINDQIYLPRGDISNKEALLRLRNQATGYSYELNFGISFTFGSIYNNIVNPRFPDYRGRDNDD